MNIKWLVPVVGLACWLQSQAVYATSYSVTTTDDENDSSPSCVTGSSTDCSLREALILANSGSTDTIVIPAGTYNLTVSGSNEDAAANKDLDFTDSDKTTVVGAGMSTTIIDGNDADRVMQVLTGAAVELSDLTLTDGALTNGTGAGIRTVGTVTLNNVTISSNQITNDDFMSPQNGAGIYCDGGTLTLNNVTVTSNTASGIGSVNGAGGTVSTNCSAVIDNSTFSSNSTANLAGGLQVALSASTSTTITDTTFNDNTATAGAGLYVQSDTGYIALVLNRVTINDNDATNVGGGLYLSAQANITNTTIYNNTATAEGGGVYIDNQTYADVVMAFSSIVQNYSDSDNNGSTPGGGIYVTGSNVDLSMNGSILAANYEGNPSVAASLTDSDCSEASGGFDSLTYSILGSSTACTPTTSTNNSVDSSSLSDIETVVLADKGGELQTLPLVSSLVLNIIPSGSCTDATGTALTSDARGMLRPQSTNCDRGAYEKDQASPTVTITSGTDTVECSTGSWTNAGATATDNFSTGLTASTSNTVDVNTLGAQTITYTSTADVDGNTGTNTRTVTVSDTTAPIITVSGSSTMTHTVGTAYSDPGATATDACAGDLTADISTINSVDTATLGTYTVTYHVTDASGNLAAEASRTVTVEAATAEDVTEEDTSEAVVTVTTNGKFVKVLVDGERVARKKINRKKFKAKYYKLKTTTLYSNYTTVAVLTATKTKAKITVLRLKNDNTLKKKVSRTFQIQQRKALKLTFKVSKDRIIAKTGQGQSKVTHTYKLTRKGRLKPL